MTAEFEFIERCFREPFSGLRAKHAGLLPVGIGDDCAALELPKGERLWVSTDTLVAGIHWFDGHRLDDVGFKALASNLSDLAAAGATPVAFTLNLAVPSTAFTQLPDLAQGLLEAATQYDCPLVGGDTTRMVTGGPLTLSITVFGRSSLAHIGFLRSSAQVGDGLWVSGLPGLARLGLLLEYQRRGQLSAVLPEAEHPLFNAFLSKVPGHITQTAHDRLHRPTPRLALGMALRGKAHACLDLSDGLSGDAQHIARQSQCQLILNQDALEALWSKALGLAHTDGLADIHGWWLQQVLIGGDDYELFFSAPETASMATLASEYDLTCVGEVVQGQGVLLHNPLTGLRPVQSQSYDHFQPWASTP